MAYLHMYGGRLRLRIDTTVSRAEITQRTYVRGVCSNEITLVAFSSKQIPTSIAEHRSRHKKKDKVRDTNCSSGKISFLWNYDARGYVEEGPQRARLLRLWRANNKISPGLHEKNLPWLAYEWDSNGTRSNVDQLAIGYAATANDDASGRGFDVEITINETGANWKQKLFQESLLHFDAKINGQ